MSAAHERVLARITVDDKGCWIFGGALNRCGYGKVASRRSDGGWSIRGTHVVVYEGLVGPVAADLQLDHLCRNRACCNPAHLEPVSPGENTRRRPVSQKTHCDRGHEFTAENTYVWRGKRHCRACRRDLDRARSGRKTEYMRGWRARNRAAVNAYARNRRAGRSIEQAPQ